MKGDFSRIRFDRQSNYTAVLTQQGRVQLDADANEQRAIDAYLRATGLVDIIGRTGAPIHDAGMAIAVTAAGDSLTIGAGRFYVDGLLCEAATALDYRHQPHLIGAQPSIAVLLRELRDRRLASLEVWLEAWQRLVTPIDDPCIKDVALGEADTTVRRQTVWRVVVAPVDPATAKRADGRTCCQVMHDVPAPRSPGLMMAGTDDSAGQSHCLPAPQAAYRGLENQLYRVEVHRGGTAAQATFKWSRENGSVLTRITAVSGSVVTVDSLGPDANLGFQPLQWVEIADDSDEFGPTPNQPGFLRQILSVDHDHRQITLTAPAPSVNVASGHAKLRRWDQDDITATADGVPMAPGGWHALENGIRVQFSSAQSYSPGDHWLVPARTATGALEWPPCDSDGADFQPAHYTQIHRAPLACVHYDAQRRRFTVEDCRDRFSPLTELQRPTVPAALHVRAMSWPNDDLLTFDQLAYRGLAVTFDATPGRIDADSFIVTLEIPALVPRYNSLKQGTTGSAAASGVLRYELIVDGSVSISGTTATWAAGIELFGEIYGMLVGQLEALADRSIFVRARVTLKGRDIGGAGAFSARFLDGQVFGHPATRADGTTPCTALTLPSGDNARAGDFESWFYLAPLPRIDTIAITPAAVAFVIVPGLREVKLVDATSGAPSASEPAVVPVLTLTTGFNALSDLVIPLSVSGGTAGIVSLPASVTVPRGATTPAAPVQVQVRNPGPVTQTFTITATMPLPSGLVIYYPVTLTVTGVTEPGGFTFTPGPIFLQGETLVAHPFLPQNPPGKP